MRMPARAYDRWLLTCLESHLMQLPWRLLEVVFCISVA